MIHAWWFWIAIGIVILALLFVAISNGMND
jgi:hypothetical protein